MKEFVKVLKCIFYVPMYSDFVLLSKFNSYNFSSEYATFSKCVYAGGLYIFTQLCKMLLLATFFPDSDGSHTSGDYDVLLVSVVFFNI